jgi:hypothetical protein
MIIKNNSVIVSCSVALLLLYTLLMNILKLHAEDQSNIHVAISIK